MKKLPWDDFLRKLQRLLAGHMYKSDEIRATAQSFGAPVLNMNFENSPRHNWFQVLNYYVQNFEDQEAKAKILEYVKEVSLISGNTPEFQLALQWEMTSVAEKTMKEEEYDEKVATNNFEKLMKKESTLLYISFFETGIEKAKSVGRIETETQWGSGFLLKDNYVLTNNHVIKDVATAQNASIEFNYELDVNGDAKKVARFKFDVDSTNHFATSDEDIDDWTIIKLKGDANSTWGIIDIAEVSMEKDERVSIIQHPEGNYKQIGIHNNFLTYVDNDKIMYLTDTLQGSSGSPVFNNKWQLVGLHNRGGYLREPSTNLRVWRNGGININKVLKGIRDAGIPEF